MVHFPGDSAQVAHFDEHASLTTNNYKLVDKAKTAESLR